MGFSLLSLTQVQLPIVEQIIVPLVSCAMKYLRGFDVSNGGNFNGYDKVTNSTSELNIRVGNFLLCLLANVFLNIELRI